MTEHVNFCDEYKQILCALSTFVNEMKKLDVLGIFQEKVLGYNYNVV